MTTRRDFLKAGVLLAASSGMSSRADETMLSRVIPGTDEHLPVVGLGTWQVFDVAGSEGEIEARRQIVAALFDAGGSLIDSSPMYNRSERIVGEVLAAGGLHERAFLATKVWIDGRDQGLQQMRRSAALMQTQRIDLMQVHNRRDIDVHWPVILELKQDGFIRYAGITDYRESANDALMALMRRYRPDFVQINYSLIERGADRALLPLAQDLGIAVLINRPFVEGRLFRAVAGRELPNWAREFADSWGQFFLKFIIGHPAVNCVIPATSKVHHMVDNAGAGIGPLPDEATRRRMIDFVETL